MRARRSMATTEILKLMTTILRSYDLELVDPDEELQTVTVGVIEKVGGLPARVRRRA